MYTKGHIILGITRDPIRLKLQDGQNAEILSRQFPKKKLFQKKPKSTPLPIYQEKSLEDIVTTSDTESLVTYVKSVLYKIFPNQTVNDQLDKGELTYENIFGSQKYGHQPYEYAYGLLPYDNINQKELKYDVTYLTENKTGMFVTISWEDISWEEDFERFQFFGPMISDLTTFAKQMFYALSESPFLNCAFSVMTEESYVEDIDEYGEHQTLKLISHHFVASPATIKCQINSLIPINWDDKIGDLLTFDDTRSLINYDGHGYYCKQDGNTTYKSSIPFNADYPIPKMLKEHFTHVLWYNR